MSVSPKPLLGVLLLLLLTLGPLVYDVDPNLQRLEQVLAPPSLAHWLGCDHLGRDTLARLLAGGRLSLVLAGSSVAIAMATGLFLGGLGAWFGRWTEFTVFRLIDLVMAFPGLLLVIVFSGLFGGSFSGVVLGLALSTWPEYAKLGFSLFRSAARASGVEAARLLGFDSVYLWRHHFLPETLAPLLTLASLRFGGAMMAIASLGFLGLGVRPPQAEWGAMVTESLPYYLEAPQLVLLPSLGIFLTVLLLQSAGDQ